MADLKEQKPVFVLVHGAWHGGWCWENIEDGLRKLGYQTIAPDLPGHGERNEDLSEQTLASYAESIAEVLKKQDQPVILVGHSMGGAVITEAAERCPGKIDRLVYMAAFMLENGQSVNGLDNGIRPIDLAARSKDGRTAPWSPAQIERFAVDCSKDDIQKFLPRLCSEAIAPLSTGVSWTKERWGSLRRFFVACTDDKAVTPETVEAMLEKNPCEAVYKLKADHLAFYSAPEELIHILDQIAQTE